jgi:hypothetical protein
MILHVDHVPQKHAMQYPILASMAHDYLAVQGSATPSERAFSSAALTDTKQCNKLSPVIFEGLQILKSAYRSGHLSASDVAQKRYTEMMQDLSILEMDVGNENGAESEQDGIV